MLDSRKKDSFFITIIHIKQFFWEKGMLFAHFSDCHVGGWKEEKLKDLNMQCFKKAIALVIERKVDFLLISGDLFNTALPQIDYI